MGAYYAQAHRRNAGGGGFPAGGNGVSIHRFENVAGAAPAVQDDTYRDIAGCLILGSTLNVGDKYLIVAGAAMDGIEMSTLSESERLANRGW